MVNRNIALIQEEYVFKDKNPMIVGVFVLEGDFKTGQTVEYEGQTGILREIQINAVRIEAVSEEEGKAAFAIDDVVYKKGSFFIYGKERV